MPLRTEMNTSTHGFKRLGVDSVTPVFLDSETNVNGTVDITAWSKWNKRKSYVVELIITTNVITVFLGSGGTVLKAAKIAYRQHKEWASILWQDIVIPQQFPNLIASIQNFDAEENTLE